MHLTAILVPLLTSLPSILANPTLDEIAPLNTRQSVLKQGVPCPGQNLSVTCSTDETEVLKCELPTKDVLKPEWKWRNYINCTALDEACYQPYLACISAGEIAKLTGAS